MPYYTLTLILWEIYTTFTFMIVDRKLEQGVKTEQIGVWAIYDVEPT